MDEKDLQKMKESIQGLVSEIGSVRKILSSHRHINSDGTSVLDGDISTKLRLFLAGTTITVAATFTISPNTSYHILSAASAVTSSTTLAITAGVSVGQILILQGTHDTNTVTIKDSAGTSLAGDATLGVGDTLTLIWSGSSWVEISRSNN